ncbi:biopolymer transport protein ExbD [Aequitasia blattaphilus]|uniref:Ig-like domain-containing protein n=1 Tax=Aequitasia blattaphilus TaxID=2949332 RepID=A0ABT1E7F9_9FIRM|nr:hypothetical protein [Aequitasia blattaphilus]MCP1101768.1 hypothetical protein [Aequitasia blattaphilus]MCR8614408.1 hypothetical protein [Aequitasia blattaphilus]
MNKTLKKIILATLFLFLCLPIFSGNKLSVVQAAELTTIDVSWSNEELNKAAMESGGKFSVVNTVNSEVSISVITLNSGDICVTGACHSYNADNPLSRRFVIPDSYNGSVILKNVNIYRPQWGSPLKLEQGAKLTLFLAGENFIEGNTYAGIHVPSGATLTIEDDSSMEGIGTLQTESASGAGIGGNPGSEDCGTVVVNGGRLLATSTGEAAGIGGYYEGSGGDVTVNGGYVTAIVKEGSGAGIGGGSRGNGGSLIINGGFISAGAIRGFDVGAGEHEYNGGTLTITGGSFFAVNGKLPVGENTNDGKGNRVYPVTVPNVHEQYGTDLRTGTAFSIGDYRAATVASESDQYGLPTDMSACVWLPQGHYSEIAIGDYHSGFIFVPGAAAKMRWSGYSINDETVGYGKVESTIQGAFITKGVKGDTITVAANPEENCIYVRDSLKIISESNPDGIALTATQTPGEYTFVMPGEEVAVSASFIAKAVSNVTVDKSEHRSSGGTSKLNISGTGLTYGVSAAVFLEGNAIPITSMLGSDTSQTATYTFPANVTGADQTYTIKVSVDGGTTYLDTPTAEVTVHSAAAPAFIVDLPESITTKATDSQITLSVAAEGDYELNYQWYKNGEPVAGATENHLVLPKGEEGSSYYVVVTDSVTSLSVQSRTCLIAKTVSSVTVDKSEHRSSGGTSKLSICGTGLAYGVSAAVFLEGNATPITSMLGGDTSQTATYTFPANVTAADQIYTIKVSVDGGTTYLDTPTAEVTVHSAVSPTLIVDLPESITTKATDSQITLSVVAEGDYALNYQWYKNGAPVEGATENRLVLPKGEEGSSYYVVVTDSVTSLSVQSKTCAVQWEKEKEENADSKSNKEAKGNPKTGDNSNLKTGDNSNPRTGDSRNSTIGLLIFLLCVTLIVWVMIIKRKTLK